MNLDEFQIIDLTHPITEAMPHWPGDPRTTLSRMHTLTEDGFNLNLLSIGEHSGTHIGAPLHFCNDGRDMSSLSAEVLVRPGIKIDISHRCAENGGYLLQPEDLFHWEKAHGGIVDRSIVLIQTGWSNKWDNPEEYFGDSKNGFGFPGLSAEATDFLIKERHVCGIGIDTAGIDGGASVTFAANKLMAENDCFHIENLANLHRLMPKDFILFVGAPAIEGGTGSPCRVLALQHK